MSGITDFADKLAAANTAYVETFDSIEIWPGSFQLFTEDVGNINATAMSIGYTEDLAQARTMKPGQDRAFDGLRAYAASYDLEEVYAALRLERIKVQNDSSGRITRELQRFVQRGASIINTKVWTKLTANTVTGPDGVALLSTAHPNGDGGATQSNKTTDALSHASYNAGKAAMRSYTRENGEDLDMTASHLFVHPDEERIAKEITGAERPVSVDNAGAVDTGTRIGVTSITNVYQGDTTVVVTPKITSGDWLLMDLTKPGVRPWALGHGAPMQAAYPDERDDYVVRKLAMLEWVISGDIAHGPGHWQAAYGKLS